jgi:putative ABC transport system permease protein
MQNFLFDVRLVLRQLQKSPGFAIAAVLMLAFGIGSTTAIFSMVDGILLRPLSFPHPEQLVTLGDEIHGLNWGSHAAGPVSPLDILSYTRNTTSFAALGGYQPEGLALSGTAHPVQLYGARMTPGVFAALQVTPLLGRVFTQREDVNRAQVVVLSYSLWKSRFGGDRGIVGRSIDLNRKPYTVIGVMPRNFEFPVSQGMLSRCQLWVPMSFTPDELAPEAAADWNFSMVGRLMPGVTVAQAQADADRVAAQNVRNLPASLSNFRFTAMVHPLREVTVRDAKPLLRILFLAVAIVLLIVCANLASLLLVRAVRYQRETAVRLALGASAGRLLRQVMLESVLLSLGGGVIGISLAALAVGLGRNLLPSSLPRVSSIAMNWPVAGFALALALLTGVLCGLAPSVAALRTNVNASLKEGGRSGSAGGGQSKIRSVLVVTEIAVALMLLSAAGLLLRSFARMSAVDLGFQPNHVITAHYVLSRADYGDQAKVNAFNQELLRRLTQLPGVEAAGLGEALPASDMAPFDSFVPEGYSTAQGPNPAAREFQVVGDYFRALGVPLLRGRYFTSSDDVKGALVTIVNQRLAERYWPHQDPLGKRLRVGTINMQTPWLTVVGEIGNARQGAPDSHVESQFYEPVVQYERDIGSFASAGDLNGNHEYIALRSPLPAGQVEEDLRTTVRALDPQLPLTDMATMNQVVSSSEAPRRFNTVLVSTFALAAVLLAILGIYGVIAFSVAARVQEMAIRMALGAQRTNIVRLVLKSGIKLAVIGCGFGLAGAAAASGLLRSFLFGVSPFDPLVLSLAAASIFVLALAAAAVPAGRAAAVDPMRTLRGE